MVALTLEPSHRTRLADQIYAQIFDQIVSGRLNVGDQLPGELELCERTGVSRPVVREALLRLRVDGLITSQQGVGTFVSHQPAPRIKGFANAEDVASYLRCQEIRMTIEGDAARLAAERHTAEQLAAIEAAHGAFSQSAMRGRLRAADDFILHTRIGAATGNDFYASALGSIHEAMTGFMHLALKLSRTAVKQRIQRVVEEHAAIVDAIRERDGERARIAMQYHLSQARRRMIDRSREES